MSLGETLLIYNPISGPDKKRIPVEFIEANLRLSDVNYTTLITEYHGHAAKYLKENKRNFKTIICSGGDGTVNEIINAPELYLNGTSMLLISQGTGNDLQRSLNKHRKTDSSNLFDFKAYTEKIKIDIGMIEGRYSDGTKFSKKFCNAIGVGLDSLIAKYVSEIKKRNNLSYIGALIKAILHYQPIGCSITDDSGNKTRKMILISVNNGLTSGGGFYLAPDASLVDGKLDLCLINKMAKIRMMYHFPKVLKNRIKEFKEVEVKQGEKFFVELENAYYLHIDGEMEEKSVKEFTVKLAKEKLSFLIQ